MLFISYANIRSLYSQLPGVELHFQEVKPDIFLFDTGPTQFIQMQELAIPGYSHLIMKQDLLDCRRHEFEAHISDGLPCVSISNNEDPYFISMFSRTVLIRSHSALMSIVLRTIE